eukprot:7387962-Prymnesium_polylepis.1
MRRRPVDGGAQLALGAHAAVGGAHGLGQQRRVVAVEDGAVGVPAAGALQPRHHPELAVAQHYYDQRQPLPHRTRQLRTRHAQRAVADAREREAGRGVVSGGGGLGCDREGRADGGGDGEAH